VTVLVPAARFQRQHAKPGRALTCGDSTLAGSRPACKRAQ
jgi:hypothetical protein